MTTIEDVAKKANTSIATVSRVLNNKTGFSNETKERVLDAVKTTGYESNAIARSLKNNKTNTIGVIIPNISSMLSSEILKGIEEYANEQEYSVLVSYTYSEPEKVLKALKTFHEQRVDGIIFTSDPLKEDYYKAIKRMTIPVVLAATESKEYPVPFVRVNDFEAALSAVSYLIDKGHQKIGMLSGPPEDLIAGKTRIDGYKQALNQAGLEVKSDNIQSHKSFGYEDGKETFKQLIKHSNEITAVFAASDEMAAGAIKVAHEMGIAIPSDISIIGYDNIFLGKVIWPTLTTTGQPLEKMGFEAMNLLVELMNHKSKTGKEIYISHEIVERDSVSDIT